MKIWVNALNAIEDGLHLMQKEGGVTLGREIGKMRYREGQAVAGRNKVERAVRKCNQGGG